jgi:ketosteroid isomerase-like protein
MMRSAHWRGMALPILCLAITACGKPGAPAKNNDPNTPAVVKAPRPLVATDTIKPPVPPVIEPDAARTIVLRDYALVGAGLAFRDAKLLTLFYAPDAVLTTPNGTARGKGAILREYQSFGMDGSVSEFQRQSIVLQVAPDSTVLDSGTYIAKRKGGRGATTETGPYASVWRIHPPPMDWVMTKDHLYSPTKKTK